MAFSVQMPALGESVTEGTVTRWLKQEGDHVEVDEPLLEVSTDKVDTEIPSPAAGTLERIVVAEDETVEVGAELAVIGDGASGDSSGDGAAPAQQRTEAPAEEASPAEEPASAEAPAEQSEPAREPEPAAASDGGGGGSGDGSGTPVTMPALGESVTEGVVTRWLKQVGDHVDVDEPLLEVSTDKVDTEIPSPVAGTLLEITAGEDETVEVGGQLALIGGGSSGSGGSAPSQAPAAPKEEAPKQPEAPKQEAPKQEAPKQDGDSPWREPEQRQPAASAPSAQGQAADTNGASPDLDANGSPYVTPLVRKLAAEHGVDLSSVHGTGVGGRIRKQDVLAAAKPAAPASAPAAAPTAAPAPAAASTPSAAEPSAAQAAQAAELRGTTQKLSRLRGVIAQRMVESLQVSAQLTAVVEVDVTRVAQLRQRAKAAFEAREGVKLSFLPFFVKATVDTLKLFPQLNASIDIEGKTVTYHDAEHIGVAVDTDKGLIVPVLHNAGDLNLAGLSRGIADLAERTRTNKIKPDELSGGTFTISNIGSRGALTDTPIINQPQVGILGTGAVVKRPVVITDSLGQDSIAIRSIAALVLTYDHRLVDGADAARFLSAIKARIETASFESDLGL
ncbi:MAG TPA: 2-oxoglutarate dehydrogenase, E2 component, dihydrolipoamide succinyltransferase [Pseudonocardia sp.]|uniref:2-oxoglutarate dehydrogenase, E2 component, dihydrolipoamide succinyltransferase n=1 Tax=Pseudonocardia sp. TaxID=60912 RepID=UPI002CA074BA|nr:2-oxoglutarate dehydrogenase, E2 component, dihydrolipoamide succinyltransferase [Pseudonocardia sp.]HTF46894.1 2-oxoglutarate dehydrogenase, E2 component, dihydrolipoamide succinyltransferase [Pseudonocardia sp.]